MKYQPRIKEKEIDDLFKAVLKLENEEECYRFFEDICTIQEIKSLAQRLQVALLLKKKKTYTYIESETGASTATISRINRALNYGSDGYNMILDRMVEEVDGK